MNERAKPEESDSSIQIPQALHGAETLQRIIVTLLPNTIITDSLTCLSDVKTVNRHPYHPGRKVGQFPA
jgi:hypothetical protein